MRYWLLLFAASCAPPNPVHDRAVDRLGDSHEKEDGLHRAGQPCVTCHGKDGPADSVFSVAGTVIGTTGVKVEMIDAAGTSPPPTVTNANGNFWISSDAWSPVYPIVSVTLSKDGDVRAMPAPIGGAGSCADCHQPANDPLTKVGPVLFVSAGGAP